QRETHEVHRTELAELFIRVSRLEAPDDDVRPDLEADVVPRVDAEERVEHPLDRSLLADLDEHGGGELSVIGQQAVVNGDLVRHLLVVDDALGTDHLLDLEPDGVAVLEDERKIASDRDATFPLQRDDRVAARLADLLV